MKAVQWRVRPAGLEEGQPLGPEPNVKLANLTEEEVKDAAKHLKANWASGGANSGGSALVMPGVQRVFEVWPGS